MNEVAEVFQDDLPVDEPEVSSETTEESQEVSEKVEESPKAEPKEEAKEPEKPETTSEEETEKQEWTFEAVKNLRREKQELREQLEQFKAEKEKPSEEPLPDIFENQDDFVKSLESKIKGETRQQIIQTQRDMMMEFKSDYEDKEKAFFEIGQDNPALIAQANASSNPAKFAYEQGEKYLKYKEMQDVDSLEAKIRAELEQKIRSELESKQKEVSEKADNLSPSLANARGTVEKEDTPPENPGDLF